MFRVYMETSGNKPLIFGGGSPDTSASEDLSGVQFVNGTRPGNTALVDLAKQQVGNVGGYPYWSWYGFNSRVEWCACFVSWCYNRAGVSEPKFAACQSQGVPWFQSRGQWGARGYAELYQTEDRKKCTECGAFFASKSNNVKYCPDCRKRITNRQAAERMRKRRALVTQ